MEARKGNYPKYPFQLIKKTIKIVLIGIVVLSSIYFINQLQLSRFFPIQTVRVYGVNHVTQAEVEDLLVPLVTNGFFNANVSYIRERLLQLPWVSDIFVRREWPDKIEITVVEKKPVANWNDESLLSEGGEIFSPRLSSYPDKLPKLRGPNGQQIIMLKYFTDINRLLLPLHAKISNLELTPYFTWKLTLDNGINLQIGHKDILTRLDHFVRVYPKIVGNRAAEVEYIDLRYPNGMAVRWKEALNV